MEDSDLNRLVVAFTLLIHTDCRAVGRAAKDHDDELERWADHDPDRLWDAIYVILNRTANLSKVFWPSKPKPNRDTLQRCERMRQIYHVDDSSPLKNRDVRNGFEHIDADLHKWMDKHEHGGIFDMVTAPTAVWAALADGLVLRSYSRGEGLVTVGTDSVFLAPLVDESARIGAVSSALRRAAMPGRYPDDEGDKDAIRQRMPLIPMVTKRVAIDDLNPYSGPGLLDE